MDKEFGWTEEEETVVYRRSWSVLYPIHAKNFEIRFGVKPEVGQHDFPTLINALHYCLTNKLLPVGDIWVMAGSIYSRVLTNEVATRNWAPEAMHLAMQEYERLKEDVMNSLRIQ